MPKTSSKGNNETRRVVVKGKEPPYVLISIEPMSIKELMERGIGDKDNDNYHLSPVELIYLAFNDYEIIINGEKTNISELIKYVENTQLLTVYLDMRSRGYFIKPVKGPVDFLVWEKGKGPIEAYPRYAIKIVTEGSGIQVSDLLQVLKYSESMGLQLVLALISTEGIVTYYKAFSFKPTKEVV